MPLEAEIALWYKVEKGRKHKDFIFLPQLTAGLWREQWDWQGNVLSAVDFTGDAFAAVLSACISNIPQHIGCLTAICCQGTFKIPGHSWVHCSVIGADLNWL